MAAKKKALTAYQYSSGTNASSKINRGKSAVLKDDPRGESEFLCLYPQVKYQQFLGFGGAFTGSAAYNYADAGDACKREMINALFNPSNGLGYTFCRSTIHSADFAPEEFSYADEPDRTLKNFSIEHDMADVVPFIKDAKAACKDLQIFASPWSPPAWMKTNGTMINGGRLRSDCAALWALYIVKYLKAYAKLGIKIFAVTVQNEPNAAQSWESCEYSAREEALFVRDHLRPTLDKNGLKNVKIIIWDHNKEHLVERSTEILSVKGVSDMVWGQGFHWYSGPHFGAVDAAFRSFPDKPLILTEFCHGDSADNWEGYRAYAEEIIGDLNGGAAAIVDWNMILDLNGGPYHNRNSGCAAALIYDQKKKKVIYKPLYHVLRQFSAFIRPGAVRIGSSVYHRDLAATAFRNRDQSIAAVVLNNADVPRNLRLRLEGQASAPFVLAPRSMSTFTIAAC